MTRKYLGLPAAWCIILGWISSPIDNADAFPTRKILPNAITFISDAAGAAFDWSSGICKNLTVKGDRGAASLRWENGVIRFCKILKWPSQLLHSVKDSKGKPFGSKSACLEMIGLLLPALEIPCVLQNRHVILEVDNISVVYSWQKRYCKKDAELSMLIRVLHVIEALLECKFHVRHRRRLSLRPPPWRTGSAGPRPPPPTTASC